MLSLKARSAGGALPPVTRREGPQLPVFSLWTQPGLWGPVTHAGLGTWALKEWMCAEHFSVLCDEWVSLGRRGWMTADSWVRRCGWRDFWVDPEDLSGWSECVLWPGLNVWVCQEKAGDALYLEWHAFELEKSLGIRSRRALQHCVEKVRIYL